MVLSVEHGERVEVPSQRASKYRRHEFLPRPPGSVTVADLVSDHRFGSSDSAIVGFDATDRPNTDDDTDRFDIPSLPGSVPTAPPETEPISSCPANGAGPVRPLTGVGLPRHSSTVADAVPVEASTESALSRTAEQTRGRHRTVAVDDPLDAPTLVLSGGPRGACTPAPQVDEPDRGAAPAGEPRTQSITVAILPAHNEEEIISTAVRALLTQTSPPDRVIVASDNSTDRTAALGRAAGATVLETVGNEDKKAGALNQVFDQLLPTLADHDVVLVQDADSKLDPHFVEAAKSYLDRGYGAVGGIFRGGPGGGFVGHLQRNEYARYARDVDRLDGKCLVITGTAALFRVQTLRQIATARSSGKLPAGNARGGVYDTTVLTEDNELTFALLHLGYRVISPSRCSLETEVMETWGQLWKQRLRWKRGAVQNCIQYGLTRVTWRYWGRQIVTFLGCLVSVAYIGSLIWAVCAGGIHIHPFWLWVTLIFVVERVVTVRHRGWRQMVLSATMYELLIDYFLQACHIKAYLDVVLGKTGNWN